MHAVLPGIQLLVHAYPEAGTNDSNPKEGRSPAGVICLKYQWSHHIDDAVPTAHMHVVLLHCISQLSFISQLSCISLLPEGHSSKMAAQVLQNQNWAEQTIYRHLDITYCNAYVVYPLQEDEAVRLSYTNMYRSHKPQAIVPAKHKLARSCHAACSVASAPQSVT